METTEAQAEAGMAAAKIATTLCLDNKVPAAANLLSELDLGSMYLAACCLVGVLVQVLRTQEADPQAAWQRYMVQAAVNMGGQ